MNYDGFDENLVQYAGGESVRHAYDRTEVVPGAYAQYTFNLNDKLILLAGVRADYSTLYDFFVTLVYILNIILLTGSISGLRQVKDSDSECAGREQLLLSSSRKCISPTIWIKKKRGIPV